MQSSSTEGFPQQEEGSNGLVGLSPILESHPSHPSASATSVTIKQQPQPIPTNRRAPILPQLESPSHVTPVRRKQQGLSSQPPAASPSSVSASRDDQFQFLVSASDFSPGPLVSPIGQRLLSSTTAATHMQRTDSGNVLTPPTTTGTEHTNGKANTNTNTNTNTNGVDKPVPSRPPSDRTFILTPPVTMESNPAPWSSQAPGPIAQSSLPQPPTSGSTANTAAAAAKSSFIASASQVPPMATLDSNYPTALQSFASISLRHHASFNPDATTESTNNSNSQRANSNRPTNSTHPMTQVQFPQVTQPFPMGSWGANGPLLQPTNSAPLPINSQASGSYLGVGWPLDGAPPLPTAHQPIPVYLSRAMGSWGNQGQLSYDPELLLLSNQGEDGVGTPTPGDRQRMVRVDSNSGSGWGGSHYPSHHAVGSHSNHHLNHLNHQHVIQSASMANSRASSLHQLHLGSLGHTQHIHSAHGAPPLSGHPHHPGQHPDPQHHHHRLQHNHTGPPPYLNAAAAGPNPLEVPLLFPGPGTPTEAPGVGVGQQGGRGLHSRLRNSGRKRDTSAATELWQLLRLALPCVVITGSTQVVIVVSQIMAGHLGTVPLAAAAIGNMLWLVGYYAIIGTCTALETLGAQAVGAGDYGRLVVWDLAAAFTCTLLAIPLAGALWNADVLAQSLLGQDPTISAVVVEYCRGLVPGLWPAVWSIIISKHMQAQSQVVLPAIAAGSAAVLYVLVALPMVEVQGLVAVSVAASIARGYQLAAMLLTVVAFESYRGARWWSSRLWLRGMARWQTARRGRMLAKFLALGAPGCLAAALESAGWEVTTAMAAYLGAVQVAVHASALSVATLVLMCVPMALAIAANIRVSSLLGSGQGQSARMCARVVVITGSVVTCLLGVVLYSIRDVLGWAFTSHDMAVVQLLCDIAPLVAVYQGVAGLLGSTQGVLRGLGRQGTLVVHNSLGLCAGTLLGAWFTWGPRAMGLPGLWAGSIVGTTITALLNGLTLLLVEWSYEVHQARNMQSMQQGVRARQQMIYRALQADEVPDDALVEALLAEAQQDPRPLHVIYQEYAWFRGGSSMASTSVAVTRAQSEGGTGRRGGQPNGENQQNTPTETTNQQQQQQQQSPASGGDGASSDPVSDVDDGQRAETNAGAGTQRSAQ